VCVGGPDVVQDGRQGQLFLLALALPVTAEVKSQRCHATLAEASREAGEEAALLAGHAATVD
jgi:hypothetical protein